MTGRKSDNHHFIRITAKVRTPVICFSAPIVYKSVAVSQLQSSLVVSNTLFLILKMQRQLPEIGKITKSLPVAAEIARGQFIGFSVIPAKNLFLYFDKPAFPFRQPAIDQPDRLGRSACPKSFFGDVKAFSFNSSIKRSPPYNRFLYAGLVYSSLARERYAKRFYLH